MFTYARPYVNSPWANDAELQIPNLTPRGRREKKTSHVVPPVSQRVDGQVTSKFGRVQKESAFPEARTTAPTHTREQKSTRRVRDVPVSVRQPHSETTKEISWFPFIAFMCLLLHYSQDSECPSAAPAGAFHFLGRARKKKRRKGLLRHQHARGSDGVTWFCPKPVNFIKYLRPVIPSIPSPRSSTHFFFSPPSMRMNPDDIPT